MKNLKDYFSSPKSSDVSLDDSSSVNRASLDSVNESELPKKRKSRALSNRNSKRKRLLIENNQSASASQSGSPLVVDDSTEELDIINVKSAKKKRKKTSDTSLSLKKQKPDKISLNISSSSVLEPVESNHISTSRKQNFFTQIRESNSPLNEKRKSHIELEDKAKNKVESVENKSVSISSSINENFLSKIRDSSPINKKSKTNGTSEKVESDSVSSNIKQNFFERSQENKSSSCKKLIKDKSKQSSSIVVGEKDIKVKRSKKGDNKAKNCSNRDEVEVIKSDSGESEFNNIINQIKLSIANELDKTPDHSDSCRVKEKEEDMKGPEEKKEVKSKSNKKKRKKKQNQSIKGESSLEVVEVKETVDKDNGEVPSPSEGRQSLLNYFNKVDKLVSTPEQEKRTIKVEAIVHSPPSVEKMETRLRVKKKVKRSKKPDYDLITSEEDSSIVMSDIPSLTPQKPAWTMRINLLPQCNGLTKVNECTFDEESDSSIEEKTPTSEVVMVNDDTNIGPHTDNINSKFTPQQLENGEIYLVEDSNSCVQLVETSSKTHTPSLKGAGTFAAYFGIKTDDKKITELEGKKEERVKDRSLAIQMFLQSSSPASLKKIIAQSVDNSECKEGIAAGFPSYSHIRQRDRLSLMWNLSHPKLKLSPLELHVPLVPKFSHLCQFGSNTELQRDPTLPSKSDIKAAQKKLETEEPDQPIKKWMQSIRTMKKNSPGGELWNEKYRPKATDDVIIERTNVEKLSEWLNTFQSNIPCENTDSSGDDFVNDKEEKVTKFGNTSLLVGPPGVGKTAAVYAAAKQNGYQVLELNASCNRNGKKVLHEFSEATQSHKVETKALFKNKSKRKNKDKQSNKKSLILVEDSDLIFSEQDDGYIACLSLLQTGSKRPLVLVANDPNSKHLMRLTSKNTFSLSFHRPDPHTLGCYLKSLSLVEGHILSQKCCDLLIESTDCDLRKSVSNLQFYGPLFNQLDRRKLMVSKCDQSVLSDCNWGKRDDALSSVRQAKTLCLIDILAPNQISGFACLRESTAVDPRLEEQTDTIRQDVGDILRNSLTLDHHPLPTYSDSSLGNDQLYDVIETAMTLGRRSIACDYLSSLRQIARAERVRLATQTKRNKRYFNQLNNLGVDTSDQHLLDTICDTLTWP